MLGVILAAITTVTVPLDCAVAEVDGAPVVDAAWLALRTEQANAIFAPQGVQFALRPARALPAAHGTMEDRGDRNGLGKLVAPKVVNCFVVTSLRDIHETWKLRQGVHWRPRGRHAGKHYVIIAAYSAPTVLAHELGHFFGNHGHSTTPGNIMSYGRGPGLPVFDARQARVIRQHLRRFLKTRELVAVPEPPPEPTSAKEPHARPRATEDRPAPAPRGP